MSYTLNISLATEQQNDIGWQAMAEGWTTEEWAIIQQEYYLEGNPLSLES
jgi:hypothetical protein